jgi:hypothetical protein
MRLKVTTVAGIKGEMIYIRVVKLIKMNIQNM